MWLSLSPNSECLTENGLEVMGDEEFDAYMAERRRRVDAARRPRRTHIASPCPETFLRRIPFELSNATAPYLPQLAALVPSGAGLSLGGDNSLDSKNHRPGGDSESDDGQSGLHCGCSVGKCVLVMQSTQRR